MTHHIVRTFKPRRRRVSPARALLMDRLRSSYLLDETGPTLDLAGVFGRDAPVVVEIGFGYGDATVVMAREERGTDVIAVDVHTPGVAGVLEAIEDDELTNVRLVHGDATVFLERLSPASLAGVRVFFPDPWPKVKQRHRRLVRPDVVAAFADRLAPGGVLHLATDIADYARQMAAFCDAEPRLERADGTPWRPSTRYEQKGLEAGRSITDLAYRRVD